MAEDLRMALQGLLRKAELDGDVDFLRDGVRVLAQELMELELPSTWALSATNAPLTVPVTETVIESGRGIRAWARSS